MYHDHSYMYVVIDITVVGLSNPCNFSSSLTGDKQAWTSINKSSNLAKI